MDPIIVEFGPEEPCALDVAAPVGAMNGIDNGESIPAFYAARITVTSKHSLIVFLEKLVPKDPAAGKPCCTGSPTYLQF